MISQIKHDRTGFEDTKISIFQGRNASVGIESKIPILFLHALGDVDGLWLVLKSELLEHDCWLETVWSAERVISQVVVGEIA